MKKILLSIAVCFMLVIIGCENPSSEESQTTTFNTKSGEPEPPHFVIYNLDWDGEWGRTSSADCSGWGLCGATDCWFCCVDENDCQVDCNTGEQSAGGGIVKIDPALGTGHLIINLNPNYAEQNNAIKQASKFYIDTDIVTPTVTVIKGVYNFDPLVGKHGGYKVNAKVNK